MAYQLEKKHDDPLAPPKCYTILHLFNVLCPDWPAEAQSPDPRKKRINEKRSTERPFSSTPVLKHSQESTLGATSYGYIGRLSKSLLPFWLTLHYLQGRRAYHLGSSLPKEDRKKRPEIACHKVSMSSDTFGCRLAVNCWWFMALLKLRYRIVRFV